jgi:ADP-heptose:LPS heptosyltransferase
MRRHVLVARLDSDGDVLLAGPAIRAVAAGADEVTLLCGPAGRHAAGLLPGVDRILEFAAPWILADPPPVQGADVDALVAAVRAADVTEAVVLTSFHQSALPLALLLRLAGVGRIAAISEDYPGSLLDVRHRVPEAIPEPERALSVAAAAGFGLPPGDDGRLRITGPLPDVTALTGPGAYVVLHPGATVPARACPPELAAAIVRALTAQGRRVLVTGGPGERPLTAATAGTDGIDLGGRTTLAELAAVLAGADAVIVGNTGPAHLAAAVGTPVVSLFAPTVPYVKWGPYGVPAVRLGDQRAPCRDSRARVCPVPGHPCLSRVTAADVVGALAQLEGVPA